MTEDSTDVAAIARTANKLARDRSLGARRSQASKASAEKQFDRRVNARALLDAIHSTEQT